MRPIFVFGSNLAGRHGKGAALEARTSYGAEYGVGKGRTGNAYGIPTKAGDLSTLPLSEIKKYVAEFLAYAKSNPELQFMLTPVGTGLAGYKHSDIAPLFRGVERLPNVQTPKEWLALLKDNPMTPRPVTYAGVGSRQTPENVLQLMNAIGRGFAGHKFKLRTGDAAGADFAFRSGAIKKLAEELKLPPKEVAKLVEVYVPFMKGRLTSSYERRPDVDLLDRLRDLANEFHPNPDALRGYGRSLQERNALQILGPRLDDPVDFLVGMLKPKALRRRPTDVGGTGQAYRMAMKYNIPIFDLAPTTPQEKLVEALNMYESKRGQDLGFRALNALIQRAAALKQG